RSAGRADRRVCRQRVEAKSLQSARVRRLGHGGRVRRRCLSGRIVAATRGQREHAEERQEAPHAPDCSHGRDLGSALVSLEREWWLRVPAVLVDPKPVFAALRNEQRDDVDARQEPLLAIVWLAGIAWVLADPVAGRIFDDPDYD